MKKEINIKEDRREFQTSLTKYLTSKSNNKPIITQIKQAKQQPEINSKEGNNKYVKKESRAVAGNQKRSVSNRSNTDQLSSLSARSSSPQPVLQIKQPTKNLNVLFYLNKIPSQPYGEYIDKMHELWFKDYEKLERDHSFIQWIFPNSFQSRFNIHARPLSSDQAEQFSRNPEIIKRYLKSYDMMLAFYGLKLKDKHTGELMRSRHPDFKERMHKTLLTSFHNHMRITRICCSLTQTGFGQYAAELCKILKFEIYDKQGFMNSLQRYNVYKDWMPFEVYDEGKGRKNIYLQKMSTKKKNNISESQSKQVQKPHQKLDSLKSEDQNCRLKSPINQKQSK